MVRSQSGPKRRGRRLFTGGSLSLAVRWIPNDARGRGVSQLDHNNLRARPGRSADRGRNRSYLRAPNIGISCSAQKPASTGLKTRLGSRNSASSLGKFHRVVAITPIRLISLPAACIPMARRRPASHHWERVRGPLTPILRSIRRPRNASRRTRPTYTR